MRDGKEIVVMQIAAKLNYLLAMAGWAKQATPTTEGKDTQGGNRGSVYVRNPVQDHHSQSTSGQYGKLPGGRSHIHERRDRRNDTRIHQSGYQIVATTVISVFFAPINIRFVYNPLQSHCFVDKGCNVTCSTDIFLTDEPSLPSPISPTNPPPLSKGRDVSWQS
jgi:hypothetical protein